MILAFNLNTAMKWLVLGETRMNRRMKAIRFGPIRPAGRMLERGRRLFVRLAGGHPSNELIFDARRRMARLLDSG